MTLDPIRFTVPGVAIPQGSKDAFFNPLSGRVQMVEAHRSLKAWRQAVSAEANNARVAARIKRIDEPVSVRVVFWLSKPPSLPKWRQWERARPDLDKLARGALDGLSGSLLADDSRVVELRVAKPYVLVGEKPRADISVVLLGERERTGVPVSETIGWYAETGAMV